MKWLAFKYIDTIYNMHLSGFLATGGSNAIIIGFSFTSTTIIRFIIMDRRLTIAWTFGRIGFCWLWAIWGFCLRFLWGLLRIQLLLHLRLEAGHPGHGFSEKGICSGSLCVFCLLPLLILLLKIVLQLFDIPPQVFVHLALGFDKLLCFGLHVMQTIMWYHVDIWDVWLSIS